MTFTPIFTPDVSLRTRDERSANATGQPPPSGSRLLSRPR